MTGIDGAVADLVSARISLGPVLYHWEAAKKRDFYFRIADEAPVDIVYLGEVVCSKRMPFFESHLPEVVERLARAGKEVVYSTLALVMSERESAVLEALAADRDLLVELNDLSGAGFLRGRSHVIGPFINVYNEGTVGYLAGNGATRVVLPAELPRGALAALTAAAPPITFETQVFGRLPLALSARCYHARANGLHKDGCQYVCGRDGNGLNVDTLDGDGFLAANGTMTLSYVVLNLVRQLDILRAAGMSVFRLWPQAVDMVAVAETFRDRLDGHLDPEAAAARVAELVSFAPLAETFYDDALPETG
jgi:collagenase-like PrtC family protease